MGSLRQSRIKSQLSGRKTEKSSKELTVATGTAERGAQESSHMQLLMDSWALPRTCMHGSDIHSVPKTLKNELQNRARPGPTEGHRHSTELQRAPHHCKGFENTSGMGTTTHRRWMEVGT